MIGIARIILVGVNNELSVNGLELNFFDTERSIGNFLNGKWESLPFFFPCTLMLERFYVHARCVL